SGIELSVWKDDLTRHVVDAVVNAANEELLHGSGLAGSLVRAGGIEIQEESSYLVATFGKVPTGKIAVTKAGRLPCHLIIHAVGPQWTAWNSQTAVELLRLAINSVLDYVCIENTQIKTVAIPALSSGIFQFPLDLCTQTILKTIQLYLQGKQRFSDLKEIHLVSNEDRTVASFKDAAELILGKDELSLWMSPGTTPSSNMTLQVGQGLTLHIVQDFIEWQTVSLWFCFLVSFSVVVFVFFFSSNNKNHFIFKMYNKNFGNFLSYFLFYYYYFLLLLLILKNFHLLPSSHFPPTLPTPPPQSQVKSGCSACVKYKVLPAPSMSRKVCNQTDQAPKKAVHAVESKPSTIIIGFSVSHHVSHIKESRPITCLSSPNPAGHPELPLDRSQHLSGWAHPSRSCLPCSCSPSFCSSSGPWELSPVLQCGFCLYHHPSPDEGSMVICKTFNSMVMGQGWFRHPLLYCPRT
ncbi:Protein mono-ADP-ribosyltransferase PARP9, partial [Lemmus lemmus]